MKIFALVCLCLLTNAFPGVWIPSGGQIAPDGKIVFNLPIINPSEMILSGEKKGFFSVPSGGPLNFNRTLAVSGQHNGASLIEISPGNFLPAENKNGYIILEDSKEVLKINLKDVSRNEKGFFAKRFSPTLQGISELKKIEEIPVTIIDLKKLRPGDSIAYSKNVDLLVNAAYGANTFFDYGVVGTISSYWDIFINLPFEEKKSENKTLVLVSYSIPEGFSFRFDKGGLPENVNLFKLWGKSQTFKYLFDLSNNQTAPPLKIARFDRTQKKENIVENANALMAYQEALKGNLVLANLLSQLRIYGVRKIFEEEKIKGSSGFNVTLEVDPNIKKDNNYIQGKARTILGHYLLENVSIHSSKGIFQNQSIQKDGIFVGFLQQIIDLEKTRGASKRRFASSLRFHNSYKNINRELVLESLKASFFKIGIIDDSFISLTLSEEKIGNLDVVLDISLSNVAMDLLMNLPDEYPENVFISQANEYMIEFFKNLTSSDHELCQNYGETNLNKCIFTAKKKTFEVMTRGYRALKEMKVKRNEINYLEFLNSFGEFGNAFLENRFSVVTFLKFINFHYRPSFSGIEKFSAKRVIEVDGRSISPPFEIRLQIKGENLKPYSKTLYSDFRDPAN